LQVWGVHFARRIGTVLNDDGAVDFFDLSPYLSMYNTQA